MTERAERAETGRNRDRDSETVSEKERFGDLAELIAKSSVASNKRSL